MPGVLTSRKQKGSLDTEVRPDSGDEAAVEPAYYKPVSASKVSSANRVPSEPTNWKSPVVMRGQRTVGMRHLWARGAQRQPISFLGTGPDIGIATWSSEFQPDLVTLHDAGFNDALYQAGYPGFNLGLSFKVAELPQQLTGPGTAMRMRSSNVRVTIQKVARSVSSSGTG